MKPIKLEFRGFITYKEKIEIDFTKLYDKKIFIISGDTGSGKTTIFDAISFALYGQTSRNIPMDKLRSDFLSSEDLYTYVKLTFEADRKIYEIERIPSQRAKKSKIDQNISHAASLYDITNEKILLAEKIGDVESEIRSIIGLDKDQFTKVMLLAQGEFQQFLHASSKERTELLGKIFKTDQYKKIQEVIKEKSQESKKDLNFIDENLKNEIEKDDEINVVIDPNERISHDFTMIKSKINEIIKNYEVKLADENNNLEKENKKYASLVEQRQKDKTFNENILKFKKISAELREKSKDEAHFNDLKEKLKKAEYAKNISLIDENLDKNKVNLLENKVNLEKANNLSKDLEEKIAQSNENYLKLDEKNQQLDELKISKIKTTDSLNSLKEFKEKELLYQQIEKDLEKISSLSLENEELKEVLEQKRKDLYDQNYDLDEKRNKSLALEKNLTDLMNSEKEINNELEIYNKNQELLQKIAENKNLLQIKESKKEVLEKDIENFEQNRKIIQINDLIDQLNSTGICPVCGENHKKHFEKIEVNDIDIEAVNANLSEINQTITKLKTQNQIFKESIKESKGIDQIQLEKSNISQQITNINEEKESLSKSIGKIRQNADGKKSELVKVTEKTQKISNILSELKEKTKDSENLKSYYQANKEKMQSLDFESLSTRLEDLNTNIERLDREIKETNEFHNNLLNKQTKNKADITNFNQNIDTLEKSIDELKKQLDEKIKEKFDSFVDYKYYLDIYKEISQKSQEIEEYFTLLAELKINYKNLKEFEDKNLVDLDRIDKEIAQTNTSIKELSNTISNLKFKNLSITGIFENIDSLAKKYESISKESVIFDKLSEIANGNNGKVAGRQKVDFQTFVLTYYFDRVLNYANQRLLQMSNGQFTMIRTSYAKSLKTQSGLDIEILDANTGKTRPASTLSGGESFLASLSLALGLSDEISAENGGITIDTLFIDEGFGTLSDDYLAKVIEQIEKLSYDNKFVGLISHVSELKDAIDGKILVTYREDKGSSLEVIAW